jgi:gluconokinase
MNTSSQTPVSGAGQSVAQAPRRPDVIIVMGVSGCGKSTVGEALAQRLGWTFHDADSFHPPANVEKMRAGSPLNDDDRWPWLDRLNSVLRHKAAKREPVVLACSALRQRYRDRLAAKLSSVLFVHLDGSFELIENRLRQRNHAYMPSSLLRSQFETLEAPQDARTVDIAKSVDQIVQELEAELTSRGISQTGS